MSLTSPLSVEQADPLSSSEAVQQTALPICEECGKVFPTQRSLASHMKSHAKPVQCPRCLEMVKYLSPHMRSRHGPDQQERAALDAVTALVEENQRLRRRVAELERAIGL